MTEIQVLKTGGKDATYEEFLKELPENDCRYGVFDIEYTDPKTKASRNKIAFYIWCLVGTCSNAILTSVVFVRCPDTAKVRTKMIFASSKDELKKRLVGIACEVQGSDAGDVALETVICMTAISMVDLPFFRLSIGCNRFRVASWMIACFTCRKLLGMLNIRGEGYSQQIFGLQQGFGVLQLISM
eukprot:767439-Hanusia_phi.AAC.3